MAVIYECDGCGVKCRATVWTCEDKWLPPNGWLSHNADIVCTEACIEKFNSSRAEVSTRRPTLKVVESE